MWFLAAHQGGPRYECSPRPRLKLLGGSGRGEEGRCGVASAWGDNSNVFSVTGRTRRLEVCDVSIIMVERRVGRGGMNRTRGSPWGRRSTCCQSTFAVCHKTVVSGFSSFRVARRREHAPDVGCRAGVGCWVVVARREQERAHQGGHNKGGRQGAPAANEGPRQCAWWRCV